jgi:hypothetical protein
VEDLPFLAIESDGSPFPQLISAKLESFCLRAQRLHKRMLETGKKHRTMMADPPEACLHHVKKIPLSIGIHNRGVSTDDKANRPYA